MRRSIGLLEAIPLLGLVLAYLILKCYSLHPTVTDDWIYAYLARRMGEGAWPYRDYFFAHPPVHLLVIVPIMKIFGFSITAVRVIPALASLASGFFLWALIRRDGGRVAGWIGMASFLFAYDVLRSSSHVTGANLSLVFLLGGTLALRNTRWITAGILLGLASLVALYTIPVIGILLLLTAYLRKPGWRRSWIAFGVLFLGLQLLVALPAPGNYLDQVYLYHQMKKKNIRRTEETIYRAAANHEIPASALPIAVGGFIALGGIGWRGRSRNEKKKLKHSSAQQKPKHHGILNPEGLNGHRVSKSLAAVFLVALAQLLFFLRLPEVYAYYLLIPYAILAAALGLGIAAWWEVMKGLISWKDGSKPGKKIRFHLPADRLPMVLMGILVTVGGLTLIKIIRPTAEGNHADGRTIEYKWRASVLPSFLDNAVHKYIWADQRIVGQKASVARLYLWHEARGLEYLDEISTELRRRIPEDACLIGDSMLAPLVALAAGRRIIDDEADTNTKRFRSGAESMDRFISRIDRESLQAIVFMEGVFLDSFPAFRAWREKNFVVAGVWDEGPGRKMTLAVRGG
ncbi:MAG: glycosyltransferase family 39 protein [Candidatus Eisenbacteria bacterium]|uniref:Glycosyltransferase family 39 protein n=1 Tax=Eiseniibacteriota bacterium TaxID=2212470 RepID=A0A948S196_UNCEI|nr:glycosyltransferase family 39 protein [Candidatus Eisenbacteria bacterium]MBU1949634.1 glycosyltransferase family 39 protein [Candidatus Eisenbacteria bacterium]MBU2693027.1 glycosyltransferase family 39 protein [Candidatus Eisenbacteria bacterium]